MPAYVLVRCDHQPCDRRISSERLLHTTQEELEAWALSIGWGAWSDQGRFSRYLCPFHAAVEAALPVPLVTTNPEGE